LRFGRGRVPASPPYLIVGRIARAHGVRGEFVVTPDTDFPERIPSLRDALLIRDESVTNVVVESVRPLGKQFLVKVQEVDSPEAAAAWRGASLAVPSEKAARLPAGQHYIHEVLGLRVETEAGELVGTVVEIIRTGSNDVYVVRGAGGEVLVPAIASVVTAIDVAGGRLLIRPLAGMGAGQ
jgi:16S rRNA processing protein RimM